MKSFTFRLQTVLEHRRIVEEQRRTDLARLRAETNGIKEEIRTLDDELRRTRSERQRQVAAGDLKRARLAEDYLHALTIRRRDREHHLAALVDQVTEARAALLAARRDHQAVESLHDRDLAIYQSELRRQEQQDLDEIASRRHG